MTAAIVDLGQSEEWFWNVTPRVMMAMLDEKRKMDVAKDRLLVHILCGGEVEEDEQPGKPKGIPGVDFPATDKL